MDFNNLKTAIEHIIEDFNWYLLVSINEELNNLFLLNLATDFVCDRFPEEEVFDENAMGYMALVLVRASHLRNMARFFSPVEW
jgi:hypothetical protein